MATSATPLKPQDNPSFATQILNILPDLVSYLSPEGVYLYVSPAYEKWFQLPAEHFLGKTVVEVVGPAHFEIARPYFAKALAGEPQIFQLDLPSESKERLGKTSFRVRYSPDFDEAGVVRGVFALVSDITEIQQFETRVSKKRARLEAAEKALQETLLYQKAIFENIPSTIYVKDVTKRMAYTYLNPAGEKMLGLREAEILGKTDFDLKPFHQAQSTAAKDLQVLESRQVSLTEKEEVQTPCGLRYINHYRVPTYDAQGNPHLLIGISRDVTEETLAKAELEKERLRSIHSAKMISMGEVSAGVAHEINNPLAVIAGSLHLLEKYKDQPEKFEAKIRAVARSVERISKIVKGLKKFSRYQENLPLVRHSLAAIVQDVLDLSEAKAKYFSIDLQSDLKTHGDFMCNELEIEQVLVNLVNNAIDAVKGLDQRWVKIAIADQGSELVLRVTDSGSGISKEVEEKLFQPFFTTKAVGEGTGLGLSISKGILDQHQASIALDRSVSNTCFEIRFPKIQGAEVVA